jgi:hypothetical protein
MGGGEKRKWISLLRIPFGLAHFNQKRCNHTFRLLDDSTQEQHGNASTLK